MYSRGTSAVCLECHAKKYGDKGSVKKYKKLVELRYTLKNLKIQCDEKAEELRTFQLQERTKEIFEGDAELRKLALRYLREGFTIPEKERKAVEDMEKLMEDQMSLLREIGLFLKIPLKKKKKVIVS